MEYNYIERDTREQDEGISACSIGKISKSIQRAKEGLLEDNENLSEAN